MSCSLTLRFSVTGGGNQGHGPRRLDKDPDFLRLLLRWHHHVPRARLLGSLAGAQLQQQCSAGESSSFTVFAFIEPSFSYE